MKTPPEIASMHEFGYEEVAEMLRVSARTVRRLVAAGRLRAKWYSQRTVRITLAAVREYQEQQPEDYFGGDGRTWPQLSAPGRNIKLPTVPACRPLVAFHKITTSEHDENPGN